MKVDVLDSAGGPRALLEFAGELQGIDLAHRPMGESGDVTRLIQFSLELDFEAVGIGPNPVRTT